MSNIERTGERCPDRQRASLSALVVAGAIGLTGVLGMAGVAQGQVPLPVPPISSVPVPAQTLPVAVPTAPRPPAAPALPVPPTSVPGLPAVPTAVPLPTALPVPGGLPSTLPRPTSGPTLPGVPTRLPVPVPAVTAPLPAAPSRPVAGAASGASVAPLFAAPQAGAPQAGTPQAGTPETGVPQTGSPETSTPVQLPTSPSGVRPVRRWLPAVIGAPGVVGTAVSAPVAATAGWLTGGAYATLPSSALGWLRPPLVAGVQPGELPFVAPVQAPITAPPGTSTRTADQSVAFRGLPVPMKVQVPALLAVGAAVLLGLLGGMDALQLRRRRT